jgi:hypothetical protein
MLEVTPARSHEGGLPVGGINHEQLTAIVTLHTRTGSSNPAAAAAAAAADPCC